MNTSNNSVTTQEKESPKNIKNLIIGLLVAGILVMGGFMIYNHSQNDQQLNNQQTELAKVTTEKSDIQSSFDASLARLDSMATTNTELQTKLSERDNEIAKMKTEIRSILNKRNASSSELARAKKLIAQLNGEINTMQEQIAFLTSENDSLKYERETLKAERVVLIRNLDSTTEVNTNLTHKVDVGSTLNASNISITPIKIKNNGKEKVKTVAKRVDKLVVSFDVNNRIIQPGTTDLYVVVVDPDGKPITDAPGSGTFTTRDEGDKSFTAKLPVDLETAKKKNVEFGFAPGEHFKKGSYIIKIYQNGFLIGQGKQDLKKGGLFS
jgi:peptidoglycan hydrolase CwlO-like protein